MKFLFSTTLSINNTKRKSMYQKKGKSYRNKGCLEPVEQLCPCIDDSQPCHCFTLGNLFLDQFSVSLQMGGILADFTGAIAGLVVESSETPA